jgi:hypothetical protein
VQDLDWSFPACSIASTTPVCGSSTHTTLVLDILIVIENQTGGKEREGLFSGGDLQEKRFYIEIREIIRW